MTSGRTGRAVMSVDELAAGIRAGDRAVLARAITLVESTREADAAHAQDLLQALLPFTGNAWRIGVTGVPGVGKSTMIDQFGLNLIAQGHRVAVLTIDPTSRRTGGSILGDKTRMTRLATNPDAFIRPSPTAGTLGGVARRTRESMILVEAAGFDVVVVETVGVGQSETTVADMVDFFLVLMLPGGGDDLQGIKKGVIEIADMIVINKADGDNQNRARRTAADYQSALNILTPQSASWLPPVLVASAVENRGLDVMWGKIREHRDRLTQSGEFQSRRQDQAVAWMRDMLQERLLAAVRANPEIRRQVEGLEDDVRHGRIVATRAVDTVVRLMNLQA